MPLTKQTQRKRNKWDYLILRIFCITKEMVDRILFKRPHKIGENIYLPPIWLRVNILDNIFSSPTTILILYNFIHLKLNKTKKQAHPKMQMWTETSSKKTYRWPMNIEKNVLSHWSSGKWESKQCKLNHLTPVRRTHTEKNTNNHCWRGLGKIKPLSTAEGNVAWFNLFGKQPGHFSKN